jgi:CRP/FNR family transcriptional regulator
MSLAEILPELAEFTMGAVLANPTLGASRREVGESIVLYEPQTPAKSLYFIETGQVRAFQIGHDGSTRLADIFGAGDWFGIAALAGSEAYGGRAVAVSRSVVWTIPVNQLIHVLGSDSSLTRRLVGQLATRLEEANNTAARMMFEDCNQRLVQTLLRFSRTAAATSLEDGGIVLRITHQQLAQAVGAARETVSLGLTQLRQRNLLRTGRNRLSFNPIALEQFSRKQLANGHPVTNGQPVKVE